jgi:hypothetical protein
MLALGEVFAMISGPQVAAAECGSLACTLALSLTDLRHCNEKLMTHTLSRRSLLTGAGSSTGDVNILNVALGLANEAISADYMKSSKLNVAAIKSQGDILMLAQRLKLGTVNA